MTRFSMTKCFAHYRHVHTTFSQGQAYAFTQRTVLKISVLIWQIAQRIAVLN